MAANDDDGRSPDVFVRIDAQWAPILEDALIDALQRYDAIHSAWARASIQNWQSARMQTSRL